MKKHSVVPVGVAALITGVAALWLAIDAPERAVRRNLAAINSLSVGQTTEAELLERKEFQAIERRCSQATCFYSMEAENGLLSKLHLAPYTSMWAMVQVRDGLVSNVSVAVIRIGMRSVSVTQVNTLPKECPASPCLKRWALPNDPVSSYSVLFDHQSDLRNRMPQVFNASCWSRLRGCSTYAEFMPLTQAMKLGQIADRPTVR